LGESAIIAEISNLIHSQLPDNHRLKCEVQFSRFIKGDSRASILTEKARADLVVASINDGKLKAEYIFEVKRAKASKKSIDCDLVRLLAVKESKPIARCFLVVVSEASRPKMFVSQKGTALHEDTDILGTNGFYKVRRVYKASSSFKKIESANFACLIEVFAK